jgi:nucleoside-diphosphate-sugar epimerase
MTVTVLGATGSIGKSLVESLQAGGSDVRALDGRSEIDPGSDLGDVIYCIGLTADFRSRPFDTVDAHVGVLRHVLEHARYSSLVYLSSTRVYRGLAVGTEDALLTVDPSNADDLYNISKLLGESLCLSQPSPRIRVVRLSNVIGPQATSASFVRSLVADAVDHGAVVIKTSAESTKNYVDIRDVADIIPRVVEHGRSRIYNVAGPAETTNAEIAAVIGQATGAELAFAPDAPTLSFPPVSISAARADLGYAPRTVDESLREMIESYRAERG